MVESPVSTRPDPSTMVGPIPYLVYGGQGNAALDFYERAFAACRVERMPLSDAPDRLMHGQCIINGGALMLTDHAMNETTPSGPALHGHLQLVVADGRTWFDRAVAAGCTAETPFEAQFWGDHWGLVRDPFGVRWAILQPGPEG